LEQIIIGASIQRNVPNNMMVNDPLPTTDYTSFIFVGALVLGYTISSLKK
jgi:hypothetical protein